MKRIVCMVVAFVFCLFNQASACSMLFVGGDYTDDGASLFVRVEDGDLNDENKLYPVSPAGTHQAGEEYHGCYGYTWTFTHDSYRYVSRRDEIWPVSVLTVKAPTIISLLRKRERTSTA